MIPPELSARLLASAPPAVVRIALVRAAGGRAVVTRSARPDAAEWSDPDTIPSAGGDRRAPILLHVVEDDPLPGAGRSMGPGRAGPPVRGAIGAARAIVVNGCSEAFNPAALLLAIHGGRIHGGALIIQCAGHDFGAWHRAVQAWAPGAECMWFAPVDAPAGHA